MGLVGSKLGKRVPEEAIQQGSVPSTPILAPKVKQDLQNDLFDPRSPTTNIARTPLQLLSAAAEKLEEYKENELYPLNNETPKANHKIILGIDPRSPTTDFKRTPIVITAEDVELPKKIHNKNLERVRQSAIITTPKSAPERPLADAEQKHVAPKLLKSSPIKPRGDANKRRSFVGLLETNIDFTETDLDAAQLEKSKVKATPSKIITLDEIDPRSPTTAFLRTPIQIIKKINNEELRDDSIIEIEPNQMKDAINLEEIGLLDHNPNQTENTVDHEEIDPNVVKKIAQKEKTDSDTFEIASVKDQLILQTDEETSRNDICVLPTEYPDKLILPKKISEFSSEDPVEIDNATSVISLGCSPAEDQEMDIPYTEDVKFLKDEKSISEVAQSAPCTPPARSSKQYLSPIPKALKSAPITPPLINITAHVKELDKKLTDLIFEDDVVVCPRIVQLKDQTNHTALKNRNGDEPEKRKQLQKLKVSDKPRRSDYAVSKIPVFREKKNAQCENTPPRNVERKIRKTRWDTANNTMII